MKTTLKKNGVEADKRLSTAHSDKSKDIRLPIFILYKFKAPQTNPIQKPI